jgi:hypothetical protein
MNNFNPENHVKLELSTEEVLDLYNALTTIKGSIPLTNLGVAEVYFKIKEHLEK